MINKIKNRGQRHEAWENEGDSHLYLTLQQWIVDASLLQYVNIQ